MKLTRLSQWLKLREDKVAGKEVKREHIPGELFGIGVGELLLVNGHGGRGRFVKNTVQPYE